MSTIKLVSATGIEYALDKKTVASINTKKCVNCGTCREVCPVGAIQEHQRTICHTCPICTDKAGVPPERVDAIPTETSCTTACPLGISPQGYINLTKAGKQEKAYELVWSKNPLPSVCARICHHPCEDSCKRNILVDNAISIRAIKRYLSENVKYSPEKYPRIFDERIAVIGAGPAGLTAAHYLSMAGYEVTVFEGDVSAGGMLKRGIPEFRLDRSIVDEEIARLQEAGLEIKCNYRFDKFTIEEIKDDYDAIIVATGTPHAKELFIDGWRLIGIMTAMNFMEQVNNNQDIRRHIGQVFDYVGKKAVIIGGGSVAVDAARAAVRLGASKVTMVCLESGDNIPAHSWEIQEAIEEGVELIEGVSPIRYTTDLYPHLTGVDLCKVTKFSNENGVIAFETDENDIMHIDADWIVVAIGQRPDKFWFDSKTENTYFAGDITSRKCSVIDAMASGRKTALEVDARLRGRELNDPMDSHVLEGAPLNEKIYPHNRRKTLRPNIPVAAVTERIVNFREIEGCFSAAEAEQEILSCLECGYHEVDEDLCIGCGACRKLCPKGDVIAMIAP